MSSLFPLTSIEIANARLWQSEIAAFQNQAFAAGGVLFTGSSSIKLWSTLADDFADIPVINRGFGGSQLSDSVYHFGKIVLPVSPRSVVLYAGDNDLAFGKTAARVVENFKAFAALMRQRLPAVPLHFISIKPSPARWSLIVQIRAANAQIQSICENDSQLNFVDMDGAMLDETGQPRAEFYMEDELHLAPDGYRAWRGVLRPHLARYADGE